ncbi:MAG: ATP-binding protein, partial [Nanoarchaeota archaeon]|nr:ATP-binding protein [Nanoarchaeota archaeon]
MKTITILSGKGGVGKSSITASLAVLLSKRKKIITADCDVDTPNLALCFGLSYTKFSWKNIETSEKAELIRKKCVRCEKCFQNCNFNAISWDDKYNLPIFNRFLCEGCGVCSLVCNSNAIKLRKVVNGKVGVGKTKYDFKIVSGQLKIGESGSGEIVSIVRKKLLDLERKEEFDFALIDSAAGIGCPVIASITGADFVIAVTEPTPAALNDLKRALKVVDHFKTPY